MKLIIIVSVAALVACDYSTSETAATTPGKIEAIADEPRKPLFDFKNFYQGAFPPANFPATNFFSRPSFPSFGYPLKTFNLAAPPQGILPPISQIVPPISQIVPPIFGNTKPVIPAPVVPPQVFPPQGLPQTFSRPLLNKFTYPFYPYNYQIPYAFPSTFSFPPTTFQAPKQPATTQTESLSTSYGPPVSAPVEPEPEGPAESSAPFEPSPISYPYEPAVPDTPEPAAPHQPAQEYGLPSSK